MPNVDAMFPSLYLKAADLANREWSLTVDRIVQEELDDKGRKVLKPVIYFRGAQKGVVLNRTNADAIRIVYGPETDHWIGKTVVLFSMRVQGPNGMTDGIRMRCPNSGAPVLAAMAVQAPLPPRVQPAGATQQMNQPGITESFDDSIPF